MMERTSPSKDNTENNRANENCLFTSPISKRSVQSQLQPNCYETPESIQRLPKIYEGQIYSQKCEQQVNDYVSTPRCTYRSVKLPNLPLHRTPPSRLQNTVIRNPFEETMRKNLDRPLVSPSLFANVLSPSQETREHFSWTIDDLASLRPAWIDEFQNQIDDPVDPEIERKIQEKIDRFFASNINLESPWAPGEAVSRIAWAFQEASSTPVKSPKVISMSFIEESEEPPAAEPPPMTDAWTQTELSLPSGVPMTVDSTIEKYCNSFMEIEDFRPFSPQWRLAASSTVSEEQMVNSPLQSSLFSSTVNNPSSSYRTPVLKLTRTSGTPLRLCSNMLSPIGVSPIVSAVSKSRRYHESPSYWHSYSEEIPSDSGAHTWSQTNLSLLRTVPSHVEAALKPYHTFTQDQSEGDEVSSLNSSYIRRRKLFHEEDNLNMSTNSISSIDKGYISS
ncbi:protein aurora borealis [Anabrus simplex]|uniref:protein aurora borealis n=1 Tax=Anabrus simplex TaxID=316456 RepID=UPI0034DDA3FA